MQLFQPLFTLLAAWGPVQELEDARIQAGGWAFDAQGTAMASDGKSLLVGAPYGRSFAIDGSARVYARDAGEPSGWREAQRLEAPGYGTIDRFGQALDVAGDIIAIGAWREERARGTVYVFERARGADSFAEVARLEPSFVRPAQRFGFTLDLDGERLLVGAPRGAPAPQFGWEGRAYLFERDAQGVWNLVAELAHPDPRSSFQPNFSHALALSGDLAVLGTYYIGFGIASEVHVFEKHGASWEHRQTLSERDVGGAGFQSFFGAALALQGNELYVMDPDRRAVHLFRREPVGPAEFTWASSFPADSSLILTVRGDRLAVGSPLFRGPNAVQVFERRDGEWSLAALLTGSNPSATRVFGSSIVLDGERILVGDPALPGPVQPEVGGVRVLVVPHGPNRANLR